MYLATVWLFPFISVLLKFISQGITLQFLPEFLHSFASSGFLIVWAYTDNDVIVRFILAQNISDSVSFKFFEIYNIGEYMYYCIGSCVDVFRQYPDRSRSL